VSAVILSATQWPDNSALIADAHRLGYIRGVVLDPTYGRGNWWKQVTPEQLITHDIRLDGVDFRRLPEPACSVDTVTLDPPYIPQGGRNTSTLIEANGSSFLDRYGLIDVPGNVHELRALIVDGIAEARRVLRPGGHLLVKCMSFVTGGAWTPMPHRLVAAAEALGYVPVDELLHLRRPGPQPRRDRQLTSRRNYSHLLVFRWPGGYVGPQLDLGAA
jgi:SAM-dependent methyltransferase